LSNFAEKQNKGRYKVKNNKKFFII